MEKPIRFKNSTETKNQELYFYGDIIDNGWKWLDTDTCPQDVLDILSEIDDNKALDIYINSGGGDCFAGLSIYNILKRCKAKKTVYIDGLAGSIASVIAMAGDEIVIPDNAFLMIHKPWSSVWGGNATDFKKMADTLDRIEEGILNVYSTKLAKDVTIETISELMAAETWLVGKEAGDYFNVNVDEPTKAVAKVGDLINNYKNVPEKLKNKPKKAQESVNDNAELELLKLQLELELE